MLADSAVRQCYAAIRRELQPGSPIAVLHIGAERTVVMAGTAEPVTRTLAIGSHRTAAESFPHLPPAPLEMERAIAVVEEEVMPVRAIVPPGATLYTPDAAPGGLAALARDAGAVLAIEDVEQLFNRLAAVSEGRPVSMESLPLDGPTYATVLILREFMHHLKFASIALRTAP